MDMYFETDGVGIKKICWSNKFVINVYDCYQIVLCV